MFPKLVRFAILAVLAHSAAAHAQVPPPHADDPGTHAPSAVSPASAATTSPETVLIRNGWATLTRGEYDRELMRLPAELRGGFGTDPSRVNALLNQMLLIKTMAARARAEGFDKSPEIEERTGAETDRLLAELYMKSLDASAAKAFDARPGLEGAARERWLANRSKYTTAETVSVTHVLFDVSKHGKEEALRLATEARASILAGADMNELAKAVSDDASAKRYDGRMESFARDQTDPAFAAAAFALRNLGDLSEPVLSRQGYHIIRLDARNPPTLRPFSEVKDSIVADMRTQYVDRQRADRIAAIRNDPQIVLNRPALDALVVLINKDELRKAQEQAEAKSQLNPGTPSASGATK